MSGSDFVYQPFSKATIELKVLERPGDTLYAEARSTTNIPRDATFSELLEISDAGTYYLRFDIDRPALSTLSLNDSTLNVVALPHDTVSIIASYLNDNLSVTFFGSGKEINEYLAAKHKKLGYHDLRTPLSNMIGQKSKYAEIVSTTDSLVTIEWDSLNNYLLKERLPEWFVRFEEAQIFYTGAGFKQHMPAYNEQFGLFDDTVPSDYYDFLASVPINNENAILSERYIWFLDDFFSRDLTFKDFEALSGYSRVSKLAGIRRSGSEEKLGGAVKDVYNQYLFGLLCQYTSDSLKIDSLAQEFNVRDANVFRQVIATKSKGGSTFHNLQAGDVIREFTVVDANDSLVSISDFADKVVYINFWATWCGPCLQNVPALNEMINEYSKSSDIVFLNICLYSKKEDWQRTIRRENLGGINLFPEGRWEEILTAEFNIKSVPTYVLLDKRNELFENHTDKAPMVKAKIGQLLRVNR